MNVQRIRLRNFRNHEETDLEFGSGANLFLGPNGQGKTNIVEGIAYLCLTKSFYAANDRTVVQSGEPGFQVSGELGSDHGATYRVTVEFDRAASAKTVSINNAPVEHLASVVGRFPVVVISPEHHSITFGSPADRRKFLDLVIAQSSRPYIEDLLEYRKALRQRNRVLLDLRLSGRRSGDVLEAWDDALVSRGARLTVRRREFMTEFGPLLTEAYREIGGAEEEPAVEYVSSVKAVSPETDAIRNAFQEELGQSQERDLRFGSTQVGPHRDEVNMSINGLDLRGYASQGQHKTFLTALKIGEYRYLQDRCGESPLLILDDVFSELDASRVARLLNIVRPLGQMFITTTDSRIFSDEFLADAGNRRFEVMNGRARDVSA